MGKENAKATAGETPAVASPEEYQAQIAELSAKVEELEQTIASQESVIQELESKLSNAEATIETGKVIVESGGVKYEVLGKFLPTLSSAAAIGDKRVAATYLHKHPEVIAELIARGSGFLNPVQ